MSYGIGRFACGNERAAFNYLDYTAFRFVDGQGDRLNMRPDYRPVDRGQDQYCKWSVLEPLLLAHVLIAREKHVEPFSLNERERFPILDSAPLHADDSMNLMRG